MAVTNNDNSRDADITETKVLQALESLKWNKFHILDGILNEYLIKITEILVTVICNIFNVILTSYFPPSVKFEE